MKCLRLSALRFRRSEDGAVLVEFALTFPLMLLFLALIVEMSRMLWSYQIALSGVRDASRYLGRVVAIDSCVGSTSSNPVAITGATATKATAIVGEALGVSGTSVFPSAVTLGAISPTYRCLSGGYRTNPAPVVKVTANLTMQVPMSGMFSFFASFPTSITTSVSDETRVFGS